MTDIFVLLFWTFFCTLNTKNWKVIFQLLLIVHSKRPLKGRKQKKNIWSKCRDASKFYMFFFLTFEIKISNIKCFTLIQRRRKHRVNGSYPFSTMWKLDWFSKVFSWQQRKKKPISFHYLIWIYQFEATALHLLKWLNLKIRHFSNRIHFDFFLLCHGGSLRWLLKYSTLYSNHSTACMI